MPRVQLSYEEQIINTLMHLKHPKGERDIIARHTREFDAMRAVLQPLYDQQHGLHAALTEVMGWVNNWDTAFLEDPEWPVTLKRVNDALTPKEPHA